MAKKPSKTFTSLDDLYGWMQGIFKSQTKKGNGLFPKDKVAANYDIRIISEPDSSDWEDILHCDYSDDFRDVISEQNEIWKPAAIGIVVNYGDKQLFCACRLAEHIDVIDGKRKSITSTPQQQPMAGHGLSLSGLGESSLGALADLREQNTCTRYEAQIANLNTEHKHDLEMKARDLRDLQEKYDKLVKENTDLKSKVAALEKENGDLQGELDDANEASAADTQSLLVGLASTIFANKGYDVSGLNGYLASRAEQQPVAELPKATVETDEPDGEGLSDGERKDAEIVMNWLRSLPEITRVEIIEVMKRVEANPNLARKLLNYIDHLYEKARQQKQLQQSKQAVAVPQSAQRPVVPPVQEEPEEAPDEEPEETNEENDYENDYNEEDNNYVATV